MRETSKEEGNLNIMKQGFKDICLTNNALISTKARDAKFWHQRLGHPLLQVMKRLGLI